MASNSFMSLTTFTMEGVTPAASGPNRSAAPGTPTVEVALANFSLPAAKMMKQAEAHVAPSGITVAIFAVRTMPASLTPSIRLPPDEFNRIPDTGRADLADVAMMSLSRFASPSANSPFSTTIVLFSLETAIVRSAADADQHAAATNPKANTPLDMTCPARPPVQFGPITPAGTPQSLTNRF